MKSFKDLKDENNIVFVYGTLKKGFYNHGVIEDSKFVGNGILRGAILLDLGDFPGLVYPTRQDPVRANARDMRIKGEVYIVDRKTMDNLDFLEGYPYLYTRKQKEIQLSDGRKVENAWVYIYNSPTDEDYEYIVPWGEWK